MIPRFVSAAILTAAIAAALGTSSGHAQAASTTAPRKTDLFSAVSFADSPLGREWSRVRPEAQARFPELRLTQAEDLHLTIVYIGGDWKREDLPRLRPLALIAPPATEQLVPTVSRLGAHDQVVAVELHGSSPAWGEAVVAAKMTLNRLGLKQPESYDSNFRSHLTLAQAKHFSPSPAEAAELAEFSAWMSAQIARDPAKFTVTVGPQTPVQLLLSNAPRARNAPEYVPLEDFLSRPPAPPAGN
jgi:2'-5' RNA ligase